MKESAIQSKIIKYLDSLENCWTVKTIATNKPGTPDILCCLSGKFIAIEVKAARGVVSKLQQYQLRQLNKAHATTIVAYSVEDVKEALWIT